MMGWAGFSIPSTWSFTAHAVEATTVISFYQSLLRAYCEKDHSLGYELLKRISLAMYQRGQAARNKMLTARSRLAQYEQS
jgi:hypothetical protein